MNFNPLTTTRTLVVAGIGLLVTITAAVALALTFKNGDPGLAARLAPERTLAYVRTTNRTELLRWVTRLESLDAGPDAAVVPEGDLYELAYIKKAGSNGWAVFAHDRALGTYEAVASDADPSLLLSLEQSSASLLQTYFFTQYVSRMQHEVIWLRPDALPMTDEAAAHVLKASLLGGTQILLLPQDGGRGKMIVDGTLPLNGRRGGGILKQSPDDLFWMSSSNLGAIASRFSTVLAEIDADLAAGISGIALSAAASKNLDELPSLWTGPLSLSVRHASGSNIAVLAAGTLRTAADVKLLEMTLAAEGAKGTIRRVPLVENMRMDVAAEFDPARETIGEWTVTELGGSPALFFGARGATFAVSTDKPALVAALSDSAVSGTSDGVFAVSFDAEYASTKFSSSLPFLGGPMKQAFQRLFGLGTGRIDLKAVSVSPVLIFDWALTPKTSDLSM